jgi:hypothetical protein
VLRENKTVICISVPTGTIMKNILPIGSPTLIQLLFISTAAIWPMNTWAQGEGKYLVSVEELGTVSANVILLGLIATDAYLPGKTIHDVNMYKITYNTKDVFGVSTVASGAIYVPQMDTDSIPIISCQHGTVIDRNQVPSRSAGDPSGLFYSGYGYITSLPDYLGMGDNPGPHPYLHWESEATASIDLIRAAREFLHDSLQIWDGPLFLTGYSQGGHATMAVHKYIHTHGLQSEFNVTASAPMAGPYSLSYAQFDYIFNEDSTYSGSYYVPYIISSYQYVYGNLYQSYDQYYDPPYDSIFAAWESSGIFFDNFPIESLPKNLYEFMQDSVLDNVLKYPDHPLRRDLRENDLHNWVPREPVRLLYCGMDITVSPSCATSTMDTMLMLGATDVTAVDVNPVMDHTTCAIPAYLYALDWFESFSTGNSLDTSFDPAEPEIRIYPNPANSSLTIETGISGEYSIEIHSVNGQLVYDRILKGTIQYIDLSSFQKGVYFITIRTKQYTGTRKIVKL